MHNEFTVFSRVVPSGKKVMYYHAYDESGRRVGPWTTGQTSRTAAKNYCVRLVREKRLIPGRSGMPTFAEYAKDWWDWEKCPYLKERRKRFTLTRSYADHNRKILRLQLVPYFGKMKLDRINREIIEKWFDYMTDKGYKNTYINVLLKCLKTMMNWAVNRKILLTNPIAEVGTLANDRKNLKIITADEFKALFVKDWQKMWNDDRIACTANKLAALTGMRISEVLGLRGEFIFDTHIYICAQYDKYGYRETKTKEKHNIPLAPAMVAELRELMSVNGSGFLFSEDGGAKPVHRQRLYRGLLKALENTGMSKTEIKERGLNVHAWRHFCNTELQRAGLTVQKVQAVTGHKTVGMTEHYTHFDPMDFGEVPKVQEGLLHDDKVQDTEPAIHLVKPDILSA